MTPVWRHGRCQPRIKVFCCVDRDMRAHKTRAVRSTVSERYLWERNLGESHLRRDFDTKVPTKMRFDALERELLAVSPELEMDSPESRLGIEPTDLRLYLRIEVAVAPQPQARILVVVPVSEQAADRIQRLLGCAYVRDKRMYLY